MKIREISGTGNGIDEKYQDSFLAALGEYRKLIEEIFTHLKDNKKDWFGQKFHTMNNWHGMYKIEIPHSIFPYQFCNMLAVDSWGNLQMSVFFPLKFDAPTFHGGSTDNMNVALVTEIYVPDIKKFAKDKKLPIELRQQALLEFKRYYERKEEEQYKQKLEECQRGIKALKAKIEEAEVIIRDYPDGIKQLEKEIKKIERVFPRL